MKYRNFSWKHENLCFVFYVMKKKIHYLAHEIKKQICIISTNVNHTIIQVKQRKKKEINEVNCPESFKLYNQDIRGVGLTDL